MSKPWMCPKCGKPFSSKRGASQHMRDKHGIEGEPKRRPKPKRDQCEEMSLADISVDAHLKRAMGEPLDELEQSLIFD